MAETIDLKDIFNVLKKRLMLIVMITILTSVSSGVYTYFFITPTYQASTQLLVNQSSSDQLIDVNDVRTNIELINTYNVIIKSPLILNKVVEELKLDQSSKQLGSQMVVTNTEDSQVIEVLVTDNDPVMAAQIANGISNVFKREIVNIMKVDNVSVLSTATENPNPVRPDMLLNVIIALIAGLMISVGMTFLLEHLDPSIKKEKDIETILAIPIIGHISTINPKQKAVKSKVIQEQVGMGGRTFES